MEFIVAVILVVHRWGMPNWQQQKAVKPVRFLPGSNRREDDFLSLSYPGFQSQRANALNSKTIFPGLGEKKGYSRKKTFEATKKVN